MRFRRECGELFKTEGGAWNHVERAHGVKREPLLEETSVAPKSESETPVSGSEKTVKNNP